MIHEYRRPPAPEAALRLHLNENTGGCSPLVLEALRRLTPEELAYYPNYAELTAACAAHFGVRETDLILTNGLDEGLLATTVAAFRDRTRPGAEAIIVQPTFDMYAACTEAVGGRIVAIPPRPDFAFPLSELVEAVSESTRLVFLTNPNNPTGQLIPRSAIERVAHRLPRGAILLLDEAYAEFARETFIDQLGRHPSLLIGRTFAKAYGLAGLRLGVLIGDAALLAPIRRVVPPYSLNVAAVVALQAALRDPAHVENYVREVDESKLLLYAACQRLGLKYWPSSANFVLVRAGGNARRLVDGLQRRGIVVRDRTSEPGCDGCVRITAGIVEHTRACIAAMEETSCDAQ